MTGWDRKALLVPRCGWKSGVCVCVLTGLSRGVGGMCACVCVSTDVDGRCCAHVFTVLDKE